MTESDEKLLQRYRELAREEPARAVDEAILAASRRAVARPSLARRWAPPLSIAAVLVLAFGVTLEMQREQPGIEYREGARPAPASKPQLAPTPAPARAPSAEPAPNRQAPAPRAEMRKAVPQALKKVAPEATEPQRVPEAFAPPAAVQAPKPAEATDALRDSNPMRDANVAPAPAARVAPAAPAAPAVPAGAPATSAVAGPRAKADRFESAPLRERALASPADPERELERIAKLREVGRNDEADKAPEELSARYPDLRIAEPMWSRVRPR